MNDILYREYRAREQGQPELRAARTPGGAPQGARTGGVFGVALSVTSNVASAAPTWPAGGVAAIPAVSLLLAVEVLVRSGRAHGQTDTARPPAADMPRPAVDTTTDVRPGLPPRTG